MNRTENKSKVDRKKIVIFGAGRIGRSFIGQVFGCNGYKVVFIDINPVIITLLNRKCSYRVIIKGDKEEEIMVPVDRAISASQEEMVAGAVSTAGILAVSVRKNALKNVIPLIAEGLKKRYNSDPSIPLDIILAENMRSAAEFVKEKLTQYLPENYPLSTNVGLV